MRSLYPAIILLGLALGCRSIVKPKASMLFEGPDVAMDKGIPLALGDDYSCILNRKGQGLCLGSQAASPLPPARWQTLHAVGSRPELKHLVARASVACAVGASPSSLENRVLCWQPDRSRSPARVDQDAILFSSKLPAPIRSLSLQKNKICALFVDGQVGCADFSSSERTLKISLVKGLRSIRSLRSGDGFSCGVRGDTGAIFCWGDNSQGQLGLGSSFVAEDEPAAIANFSGYALAVEAGTQHACGINQAGEVFCWGRNSDQQLAVEGEKHVEPQLVMGLPAKATALALGERHSCAQLVGGSVWCWGLREALGSDTHGGLIPVRVPLPTPSSMLVASSDRSCAQLTNGSFYCWGEEPEPFNVPP